jgi:hypothetical protein
VEAAAAAGGRAEVGKVELAVEAAAGSRAEAGIAELAVAVGPSSQLFPHK